MNRIVVAGISLLVLALVGTHPHEAVAMSSAVVRPGFDLLLRLAGG
jgi:hypothetical protein